jgi:hypothetical protein
MPYFTHASRCTNIYASAQGGGSGVGHEWTNASAPELVKWTAIPIYNGALDGNAGSINARWDKSDGRFNAEISKAMSKTRWRDIKHNFKLNNNYLYTKKKGDDGYDPTSKYDLPYKALIHNMNNVTKRGDMDVTLDESTWGFGGYSGECGGRLINKPVARGMSLFVANCIIFVILLTSLSKIPLVYANVVYKYTNCAINSGVYDLSKYNWLLSNDEYG